MSLWSSVAEHYADAVPLRAGPLAQAVTVQFRGGVLAIALPNGVERRIDSEEFRAAWRTITAGGGADSLRVVTASGIYLEAVVAELRRAGVSDDVDTDRVEGPVETRLVREAETRAAQAEAALADPGDSALRADLDAARLEIDDHVRERARLEAAVEGLRDQLAQEAARADGLAAAVEEARRQTKAAVAQRTRLVDAVRAELAGVGLSPELQSALERAVTLAEQHPDSGIVQCRKVHEILAQQLWRHVMAADTLPPFTRFSQLMEDLRDQRGVDPGDWHLLKTLYGAANASAHEMDRATARWALTLILVTSQVARRVETVTG